MTSKGCALRSRRAFTITDSELKRHRGAGPDRADQDAAERDTGRRPRSARRACCRRTPGTGSAGCCASVARDRRRARTMPRRSPLTRVIAGALDRDVGAGAHRDADGRLRQRRRVVDAVAGHRHQTAGPLQLRDDRALVRRAARSARTSSIPSCRAIASAVTRLSPVSMMSDRPFGLQRGDGVGCRRRESDRRPRSAPASWPSTATTTTVCPSRRRASARAANGVGSMPRSRMKFGGAERRPAALPPRPLTPCPVVDRNADAGGTPIGGVTASRPRRDDRRGERMLAAALDRGGEPEHVVLGPRSGDGSIAVTRGRPSVSVPVLSTTSVSTRASSSSASAFLISTPALAPRPVPTMIAIGVARPSAHGQAMISTATALTSACAKRGSGPNAAHTTNVDHRGGDHRRHEVGRDAIGEPLNRRARALRLADHPHDLREQRVAADALARAS